MKITLANKNARYIAFVGGILMIAYFIWYTYRFIGGRFSVGVVEEVGTIYESHSVGSALRNHYFQTDLCVLVDGDSYELIVYRKFEKQIPSVGDEIKVFLTKENEIFDATTFSFKSWLGMVIVVVLGGVLLLSSFKGEVKSDA